MRTRPIRFLSAAVASLAVLAFASSSRADFEINVFVNGTLVDTITPTTGPSGPGTNASTINVDTQALNTDLGGLGFGNVTFSNLTATSNQSTVTGQQDATLGVNGLVTVAAGTGPDVIRILVGSTDFTAPAGSGTLLSTASDTFNGFGPGNFRSFQSYYDPANGQNTMTGFTPGLQVFVPTAAMPSTSGTSTIPVGVLASPFSLTNDTVIILGGSLADASDRFAGATTIRAVPEPGSMALVLVGLSAVGVASRRLRNKARLAN